jgi:hypothetical protein
MSQIREQLRHAIDRERRLEAQRVPAPSDARAEAAFRPVREAAEEIKDELSHVPNLKMTIGPSSVWIELYDKHLWFSYDAGRNVFVGDEVDSLWIEGGLREESFTWADAEACIQAMVEACARYVSLAEAITRFRPTR